jgi:16S rRNA (uracil1498-N3)-methyltransferase
LSRNRFFVSPEQIRGERVSFFGNQARQICGVLRMREAQQIEVLDNQGWRYEVHLERVSSELVTGSIVSRSAAEGDPATHLTLYQAMLKKDNFEWILQKGTEIGVARFVPLVSERTLIRQEAPNPAKEQRWRRIISEAAEQSGRAYLPLLSAPESFDAALLSAGEFDAALIPWERETENGLVDALAKISGRQLQLPVRLALFIGPEGGFSESEIERAGKAGVLPVSLGRRILRAETAAIVASTLALFAMGDL